MHAAEDFVMELNNPWAIRRIVVLDFFARKFRDLTTDNGHSPREGKMGVSHGATPE
jgi:hypothetical protein